MYLTKRLHFFPLNSSETILINSLSGAIDRVPNHMASKLKEVFDRDPPNVNFELMPQVTAYLKDRGYLFETIADEQHYLLEICEKTNQIYDQRPVKFTICPTYSCNLRCTYCYEGELGIKNTGLMNENQLTAVFTAIDKIRAHRPGSSSQFELFGGEPLLSITKPIVEKLFQELRRRKESLAIVTNGTNILDYKFLLQEYRDNIDTIQVTLDGPKEIHNNRRMYANGTGTFDKIVSGINYLLELGIHVRLRVNIDEQNIKQLPELIELIESKNWTYYHHFLCDVAPVTFHTSNVHSTNVMSEDQAVRIILDMFPDMATMRNTLNFGMFRALNYVSSILEPTRQFVSVLPITSYCEATRHQSFVFGPDGRIYICPDSIIDTKYSIGTYYPTFEIDKKKMLYWKRDIQSIPKCKTCDVALFCGGGCALVPLCKGDGEPACDRAREVLYAYIETWRERMGNR